MRDKDSAMDEIKITPADRVEAPDGRSFIVIVEDNNAYRLRRYWRRYDKEEDVDYDIRESDFEGGRFLDRSRAREEAERLLAVRS